MKLKLPKVKSKRGNILVLFVGVIAIFGILIAFFGAGMLFSFGYAGGWEVRSELHSVQVSGNWYTQTTAPVGDIPWGPKVAKFDATDPDIYPDWDVVREPDIHISVDDPIHTKEDSSGNLVTNRAGSVTSVPLDEPNNEFQKIIGEETFFYYEHIYAYLVTVRTQGDQFDQGYLWQSLLEMRGEEGIALTFTVRTKFSVSPWNIVGQTYTDDAGDDFMVTQAWVGIMSASAEVVESGFTERSIEAMDAIDQVAKSPTGWEMLSLPQEHGSLNMYTVDGNPAENSDIDTYGAVRDVPAGVLIDVSGHLWNGGEQPLATLAVTHDVFMSVLVKVSVLTHAAYAPITGTDPIADPPDDDRSGPQPFWFPLAYALGNLWGDYWWLIVGIVGIVAVVLVLIVLTRLKALFG
jgi:hypothetical protein